jgi:hypothetical protein
MKYRKEGQPYLALPSSISKTLTNCGFRKFYKKKFPQVGLIVFLSHLGSFVPAESADLPLFSAIYTRYWEV